METFKRRVLLVLLFPISFLYEWGKRQVELHKQLGKDMAATFVLVWRGWPNDKV